MKKILDVAIQLSDDHDVSDWDELNQVMNSVAGHSVSAGTGLGYRDFQFKCPTPSAAKKLRNKIQRIVQEAGFEIQFTEIS